MHRHTPTLRQSRMNLNYIYYRVEQLEMIVHRMAHTHTHRQWHAYIIVVGRG